MSVRPLWKAKRIRKIGRRNERQNKKRQNPISRLLTIPRRTSLPVLQSECLTFLPRTDQGRRFVPYIQKVWLRFLSVESTLCRHKGEKQRTFHFKPSACGDRCAQGTTRTSIWLPPRRTETYCLSVSATNERETEKRTRKTDLCASLSRCQKALLE